MILVVYTDGSEDVYEDIEAAENGIIDTITGCDFAVAVARAENHDGQPLYCSWKVRLRMNTGE